MKVGLALAIAIIISAISSAILGYALAALQFQEKIGVIEEKIDALTYTAEVINAKEHVEDSLLYAQAIIEDECIVKSIGNVLNENLTVKTDTKALANTLFLSKLKHDLKLLNGTIAPERYMGIHEQLINILKDYVENYEKYIVYFESNTTCENLKAILTMLNSGYNKISALTNAIVKNLPK